MENRRKFHSFPLFACQQRFVDSLIIAVITRDFRIGRARACVYVCVDTTEPSVSGNFDAIKCQRCHIVPLINLDANEFPSLPGFNAIEFQRWRVIDATKFERRRIFSSNENEQH